MASRREQNMKYRRYSGRVNGNLAYDPAYVVQLFHPNCLAHFENYYK